MSQEIIDAIFNIIFPLLGGLALFLFGMSMLSDGLKKVAGNRLRQLLEKVTKRPITALIVGAGITALIQSSSGTTVIVVGLVNAGLLALRQAICVVMGANIGTTMTAWLVGLAMLKISLYAMPIIVLGIIFQFAGKRQRTKNIGQILLGFGILFVGIGFMKGAFAPLRNDEGVKQFLASFSDNPILAVFIGAGITVLIQSSSASIAIIQAIAVGGLFGSDPEVAFRVAIPFVLGDNIGTTITAQLAALQSNVHARRAAMAHTLFNVFGTCWVLPLVLLGFFPDIVSRITPWTLSFNNIALEIAAAHSVFNVINALVFLPLVGVLERMVVRFVPARKGDIQLQPVTLDRNLLATPPVAMDQARRELVRMTNAARDALNDAIESILHDDRAALKRVAFKEDAVDEFQTEITRYLVELSQRTLSAEAASEVPVLLHTVNDVERIGDHAVNITEIATRKLDQRYAFSQSAAADMERMRNEITLMFEDVLEAIADNDTSSAENALKHEHAINMMQMEFRRSHVRRLGEGTCSAMAGLLFVDFVDNMEKIGDHLTNIAQAVIGGLQWDKKTVPEPVKMNIE
ncbi:MAG: Na/Pi cotransporter family protein [Planctomycetota bacterium]|nr:Na/Pi cotransporter family protein [Planctomycetota bacterium]